MVLPHRNPLLAAKMLATIDVLSGGRLIVGTGTGWLREEFQALRLPPFEERGKVASEYIRVFRELWSNETSNFKGQYADFSGVKLLPKPVQKPRVPIWVGGESRRAMERAARLGDGWYPTLNNPSHDMRILKNLTSVASEFKAQLKAVGRNLDEVVLALGDVKSQPNLQADAKTLFSGGAEKIRRDIADCERLGVRYLGFTLRGGTVEETLQKMDSFASQVMDKMK